MYEPPHNEYFAEFFSREHSTYGFDKLTAEQRRAFRDLREEREYEETQLYETAFRAAYKE
jgi:hypothetical protein